MLYNKHSDTHTHTLPTPIRSTYVHIPNTGIVVEEGMQLPDVLDVPQIPHIQTVIVVNATQLEYKERTTKLQQIRDIRSIRTTPT